MQDKIFEGVADTLYIPLTARRILKGKVGLYSKVAMAIADRTGRAFLLHMKL